MRTNWHSTALIIAFAIFFGVTGRSAHAFDNAGWAITGLRPQVGGGWQFVNVGGVNYYLVDQGALRNTNTAGQTNDITWYLATDDCGDASHKPGGNKMNHAHVFRANYPTQGWVLPGPVVMSPIAQASAEAFWKLILYNDNNDGTARIDSGFTDPNDGANYKVVWGSADFHFNCYGYVFDYMLSQYKLVINDGATGAGVVMAAAYTQQTPVTNVFGRAMYMDTKHINYVNSVWTDCPNRVAGLMFKFRDSQGFTFTYPYPGRRTAKTFLGTAPTYWDQN